MRVYDALPFWHLAHHHNSVAQLSLYLSLPSEMPLSVLLLPATTDPSSHHRHQCALAHGPLRYGAAYYTRCRQTRTHVHKRGHTAASRCIIDTHKQRLACTHMHAAHGPRPHGGAGSEGADGEGWPGKCAALASLGAQHLPPTCHSHVRQRPLIAPPTPHAPPSHPPLAV